MNITTRHTSQARIWDTHHLTIVLDLNARGGMYAPELHLHRRGRNGSPAGFGSKLWPSWLRRMADNTGAEFGGMLRIRLPHVGWGTAYRLRRFGGLRAYKATHRVMVAICTDRGAR